MSKPLYEHDCERCYFLGSFTVNISKAKIYVMNMSYDAYVYYETIDNTFCLIARWGNEGSQYSSNSRTLVEWEEMAKREDLVDYPLVRAFRLYEAADLDAINNLGLGAPPYPGWHSSYNESNDNWEWNYGARNQSYYANGVYWDEYDKTWILCQSDGLYTEKADSTRQGMIFFHEHT